MDTESVHPGRALVLTILFGLGACLFPQLPFFFIENGPVKTGLVPNLIFPLLVSALLGWRWGLLAVALSFLLDMTYLRSPDFEPVLALAVLPRYLWCAWHGTAFPFRKKTTFSPYLKELIFSVPFSVILIFLLPDLPSHWPVKSVPPALPGGEMRWGFPSLVFEGFLNRLTVLLVVEFLSRLGVVRRLFGLKPDGTSGKRDAAFLLWPAAAFAFWLLDAFLHFLLRLKGDGGYAAYLAGVDPGDLYGRILVTCLCLFGGILYHDFMKRLREEHAKRLASEEALVSREEEYRSRLERIVEEKTRSLSQFAALVENSGDFIGMATLEGKVLYVNRAGRAMAGLGDREDISINDFTPKDSSIFKTVTMPTLEREGKWFSEGFINNLTTGEKIPVLLHVFLLSDEATGRPYRICTIIRDARAQTEDRARIAESKRRMEALLDSITETAFLTTPDGIILEANRTIGKRLGINHLDLIGRDISTIAPPETAAFRKSKAKEMLERKEPVRFEDNVAGHIIDMVFYPVFDDAGTITACAIFGRDITQLKEAEEQKLRHLEDLERSNYELERFAYISSHDLQEPLRSIVSFLQLLEKKYGERLDDTARLYIDRAEKASMRLANMIQDLLDYSRVSRRSEGFSPTNLNAAVRSALDDLTKAIEKTKATITVHPLPGVVADPSQMTRLFLNLIGNAVKYSRAGVPPLVEVSSERTGDFWTVSVKDNGLGIEAVHHMRIFEVFQRLHSTDKYEGTGLGLAFCKRIVERHGGRIWVDSVPGEGSAFRFTLPANLTAPGPKKRPPGHDGQGPFVS